MAFIYRRPTILFRYPLPNYISLLLQQLLPSFDLGTVYHRLSNGYKRERHYTFYLLRGLFGPLTDFKGPSQKFYDNPTKNLLLSLVDFLLVYGFFLCS